VSKKTVILKVKDTNIHRKIVPVSYKRGCFAKVSNVAFFEKYITSDEFKDTYELARRTRAAVRGFINYLIKYEGRKANNLEP
jgi:hypothetical protein